MKERDKNRMVYKVTAYMVELYRDDLVDLLNTAHDPPKLDIRKDARTGMVLIENVKEEPVETLQELLKLMHRGIDRRHTGCTKMNTDSSRSHLVMSVLLTGTDVKNARKSVQMGKISLVDLAGCERLKKSGVSGDAAKEAVAINKSLSALGDVIEALTSGKTHVPYRNHKLTQLMMDSLGGNAKTLMFVNISPAASNVDETLAALAYATRAKQVTNKVSKNEESQEVTRLKQVIASMSKQLEGQGGKGAAE
jgi:hypothetical protein